MKQEFTEIDGVPYDRHGDAIFTEGMIKDYTLLVPEMSEIHFKFLKILFEERGYNVKLLDDSDTKEVAEVGLRFIHNDMCYPATLVIGLLMRAVLSGKYDTHKIALVLVNTAGGCRASNYIPILKKILKKNGYGYIPVLGMTFDGTNHHPGFRFKMDFIAGMLRMLYYGDLLTMMMEQCGPYEKEKGASRRLLDQWIDKVGSEFSDRKSKKESHIIQNYYRIISDFEKIPLNDMKKPKVGIVGESYVKYAPLGNNNLVRYLNDSGAETVMPGFTNYIIYCIHSTVQNAETYGMNRFKGLVARRFCKKLTDRYKVIQKALAQSKFMDIVTFEEAHEFGKDIISRAVRMGEGWFLVAEIIELIHQGVKNVIIVQPFGCLPNHIVGRGTMKRFKELYPDINIISIDYDSSASTVNQENRIKLLLSNAKY